MARYKTGQKAPRIQTYTFDRYVDDPQDPPPTEEEREIPLSTGEVFPPIRSSGRSAYWRD